MAKTQNKEIDEPVLEPIVVQPVHDEPEPETAVKMRAQKRLDALMAERLPVVEPEEAKEEE